MTSVLGMVEDLGRAIADVDEADALAELAGVPGYRPASARPRAIAKLRALEARGIRGGRAPAELRPFLGELVDDAVRANA